MAKNLSPLQYERVKERARRESALRSLAGREISPLPPIEDRNRRRRGEASLLDFCREYFPAKFSKPFGRNHYALVEALEDKINNGGKVAVAMPRGTGKTTIAQAAAVWAALTARRRFIVIVAANTKEARKLLKALVMIIGGNETLRADFPEVCVPVAALKGSALLARGQLFYGEPTNVQISADQFRLPTIPGSRASGSVIAAYGVKASIRGLSAEAPDGATIRPDFLFLDDLQTDQIAINPRRVADLEEIVAGTLEGLVENGREIAAVMTCTVKAPDDFSDRMLNREIYPRWNGLRFASLASMPERLDLWREYRARWYEDEGEATKFYKRNRKAMSAGAVVTWPEAYSEGRCADALEYYMTRWCENERAFWSEQQNQPLEVGGGAVKLPAKAIARKLSGYDRGVLPEDSAKITAGVDVHADVLYWVVVSWNADFTGRILDFGTYPEQKRLYFSKNDGGLNTLTTEFPTLTADGRLQKGLTELFGLLATFPGGHIDRVLVDEGWKPEVVENAIRTTNPRLFVPAKGVAVTAKGRPMAQWARRPGRAFGWRLIDEKGARGLRLILHDANYWKTKIHESLSLEPGERGSLSVWGTIDAPPPRLRMFSEHLSAETAKLVESGSNRVVEWSPNLNRPDNHFFDALVGCFVAASSLGLITTDQRDGLR